MTFMNKSKILFHICCAPDAAVVLNDFNGNYDAACYFYNPNIHPAEEYEKRLNEMRKLSSLMEAPLSVEEPDAGNWSTAVKGLEGEPEGGKRCEICFRIRLEKTAVFAKKNGFDLFTTVLSVSPHKNAKLINEIGKQAATAHSIKFMEADFKKNNGFKRSIELSKKYGLYRQNYCGCIYSRRSIVVSR